MSPRRSPRSYAVPVVLAATLAVTAACASPNAFGPSGPAVVRVAASTPTTGTATGDVDSVTWYGDYRPVVSLDPLKLSDYPEETVIPNLCEPLFRAAPDYTLSPGLAAAYTVVDPLHVDLTIRTGVKFSDGKPMTADDVVFSLNRNLDPQVASNYSYLFTRVKSITATGTHTVRIDFTEPDTTFKTALGVLAGAVVEKTFTQQAGQDFGSPQTGVRCTGPFTLGSYDGTSKLVLNSNENYWDPAHRAHAKTFTFVFPTDPSALATGLSSGAIDGGFDIPGGLIAQLSSASNGKLYLGQEGSTPINVDIVLAKAGGTLGDPRVRQALSMALDRKAIGEKLFQGAADALYKPTGPGFWGQHAGDYSPAYQSYEKPTDVAGAKKLVQAAGAGGKSFSFGYPTGDPQSVQLATVLKQTAESIGLAANIVGLPSQQYGALFNDPSARKPYDAFLTKSYIELPEPLLMDKFYGAPEGAGNFSGYADKTVTDNLDQATLTADPAARAKLVLTAEAQLAKDLPLIPVVQPRAVVFLNSRLTGATLTFSYTTTAWAAAIGGN